MNAVFLYEQHLVDAAGQKAGEAAREEGGRAPQSDRHVVTKSGSVVRAHCHRSLDCNLAAPSLLRSLPPWGFHVFSSIGTLHRIPVFFTLFLDLPVLLLVTGGK